MQFTTSVEDRLSSSCLFIPFDIYCQLIKYSHARYIAEVKSNFGNKNLTCQTQLKSFKK